MLSYLKKIMQWELWGNNVVNTWLPCPVEREGHSKLEGQLNVGGTFKSCISLNFILRAYLLHPNYICMVSKIDQKEDQESL